VIFALSDYYGPLEFAMDAARFYAPGLALSLLAGLARDHAGELTK
jgi:hypothetical protein